MDYRWSAGRWVIRPHEFKHVLVNLTYLALAVFVAWGRFGPGYPG